MTICGENVCVHGDHGDLALFWGGSTGIVYICTSWNIPLPQYIFVLISQYSKIESVHRGTPKYWFPAMVSSKDFLGVYSGTFWAANPDCSPNSDTQPKTKFGEKLEPCVSSWKICWADQIFQGVSVKLWTLLGWSNVLRELFPMTARYQEWEWVSDCFSESAQV